ncbi:hypothetical protein L202_00105 [Cryptococcus amylolentus CBS 6039]|uniref:Exonuclease domain-containing protein n=1 Tax=Cryptococcus amylolentus CBS 6039 TaxID=1295533 RepID=A0A1E3I6E9_9TREE|nr:hypothetical protein L202_00105 [Cryptococcus amylolentus CBS 6039]ODN84088.1 hypothetical protein L202_00105 [Cryptococcus amylolentus CBS 6039]
MFSNLGLFATAKCPDPECARARCFFAHGQAHAVSPVSGPSRAASSVALPRNVETKIVTEASGVKRKMDAEIAEGGAGAKKQVVPSSRPGVPVSTSLTAAPEPPPYTSSIPSRASSSADYGRPPNLPLNIKVTPQPRTDRQKGLATLFTQFSKLYGPIIHLEPSLAHDTTLSQENEISASSSSLRTYKTAIHHAAVSISRRPPPTSLSHPSVGTVKESREKGEKAEKEKSERLERSRVERYFLKKEDFAKWGYPLPDDPELVGEGTGSKPSGEGETHNCDRCKISFTVSSQNLAARFGECRYHYGRTAPERVEGRRKWIYSCCGKERGEAGCEDGVHVFKEEDDQALARREGFMSVRTCAEESKRDGKSIVGDGFGVVAMDCEMINTTAGLSLGRVTIVDENGNILLDELVRQSVPILDVNTRFSGISPGQLDSALMDLPAVRSAACMFIGPETVIVGHGLENDLRALRLLHDKMIDTAIVFPHDKGPPFRRALRDIVKEKLGYFIQDRTSDLGHSSAVDAKATLDALKWKVRDDNE